MRATRSPRGTWADIVTEALRPDAAPPVAIHLRPELLEVVGPTALSRPVAPIVRAASGRATGIRLVPDEHIPAHPGYEIHRAAPQGRGDHAGPATVPLLTAVG